MAAKRSRWAGKTVVVTGSTSGIGRATAENFAGEGAFVIVHGRDRTLAEAIVTDIGESGGRAAFLVADLEEPAAPDALMDFAVRESGRLDVLVNNAGTNVFAGVLAAEEEEWERCLAVDLRAFWLCARSAARVMPARSAIVNVASNHAFATLPGVFPYNVAKAGVVALTQSLALELAPREIRANVVCPGYIDTPINVEYFATFSDPEDERRRVEMLHPLGRLGQPIEVAHLISFLADPEEAGFVTGSAFVIDGGRSALLQDPVR